MPDQDFCTGRFLFRLDKRKPDEGEAHAQRHRAKTSEEAESYRVYDNGPSCRFASLEKADGDEGEDGYGQQYCDNKEEWTPESSPHGVSFFYEFTGQAE